MSIGGVRRRGSSTRRWTFGGGRRAPLWEDTLQGGQKPEFSKGARSSSFSRMLVQDVRRPGGAEASEVFLKDSRANASGTKAFSLYGLSPGLKHLKHFWGYNPRNKNIYPSIGSLWCLYRVSIGAHTRHECFSHQKSHLNSLFSYNCGLKHYF